MADRSLNCLIEFKSAPQITAHAGERLIASQLPTRKRTGAHAFFRCHSLATDILQEHIHTLVFALSSQKQLNLVCSPVEVNEGLFTLQH